MTELVDLQQRRERKTWLEAVRNRDSILVARVCSEIDVVVARVAREGGVTPEYLKRLIGQAVKK